MVKTKEFTTDPFEQFQDWYRQAGRLGLLRWFLSKLYPPATLHQPDSMTLATATQAGKPSARIVLLKEVSKNGFVFYTNYNSRKADELAENPLGSLLFHWGLPERQVRIEGRVVKVSRDESSAYWRTRPGGSKLSGLISRQSKVVASRETLENAVAEAARKYSGAEIPCPEFWGGYRLEPEYFEFWEGRINRLHDRMCYLRQNDGWQIRCLYP